MRTAPDLCLNVVLLLEFLLCSVVNFNDDDNNTKRWFNIAKDVFILRYLYSGIAQPAVCV
jgi:hypothetical protein